MIVWIGIAVTLLVAIGVVASCRAAEAGPPTGATSPLAFTLTRNDGTPYPLEQHRGQVLLIVNTASKCGFTPQYDGLQALFTTYQAKGLVVIGQPSNDFLSQDPGTDSEIAAFCKLNFGVTFPLMSKAAVSGGNIFPLYRYLTKESPQAGSIKWNFTKFLIGRDGKVVDRFGPSTKPQDPVVIAAVERELAKPVASAEVPSAKP
jgi:glutathione peroxidase